MGLKTVYVDARDFERLAETYEIHPLLGRIPVRDRQHIAIYSVSDLEGLATYNLRHVANQFILDAVRQVNHAQGIDKDLRIAPPEAFLPPLSV